ncbi:MAG: hypothetical protein GF370_00895 [Candidatus Nealsonbacteria bacterium]|nr:hypothetical protein [Candidatus Nealsonbacteria bacterium]
MATGMLYNIFVCFITGLTGIVVFNLLRRTRKEKNKTYSEGIDYFCLLFGLVWILTGLGVLFVWLGHPELDVFVFKWFTSPLIYIHLLPVFYYFTWSLFRKKQKLRLFLNIVFTLIAVLTILSFWKYGFSRSEITYWGSTLVPNELTNNLFTFAIFIPALLFIIIELIRRFKRWKETGNSTERQLFGFNLGFLIYAITGFFDALASAQGWLMLLARIGSMLPPLIFYLFATLEDEKGS